MTTTPVAAPVTDTVLEMRLIFRSRYRITHARDKRTISLVAQQKQMNGATTA